MKALIDRLGSVDVEWKDFSTEAAIAGDVLAQGLTSTRKSPQEAKLFLVANIFRGVSSHGIRGRLEKNDRCVAWGEDIEESLETFSKLFDLQLLDGNK